MNRGVASRCAAAWLALLGLAACDSVFSTRPPDVRPIDGDPNVDTDGDGLFDDVDNCRELPNVSQHDEDRDGAGDGCDSCPYVMGSQGDSDRDDIGDPCDPDPQAATERIARFDSFEIPTSYPCGGNANEGFNCVVPTAGTLEVEGDALHIGGPTQFIIETYVPTETIRYYEAAVRLETEADSDNYARLITRSNTDVTMNYIACGITRDADKALLVITHYRIDKAFSTQPATLSAWPPPPRVVLQLEIPATADATATCHARSPEASQSATIDLPVAERPQSYGLWVNHMRASFEYIALMVAP